MTERGAPTKAVPRRLELAYKTSDTTAPTATKNVLVPRVMVCVVYAVRRSLKASTINTMRRMVPSPMYTMRSFLRPGSRAANGGIVPVHYQPTLECIH